MRRLSSLSSTRRTVGASAIILGSGMRQDRPPPVPTAAGRSTCRAPSFRPAPLVQGRIEPVRGARGAGRLLPAHGEILAALGPRRTLMAQKRTLNSAVATRNSSLRRLRILRPLRAFYSPGLGVTTRRTEY